MISLWLIKNWKIQCLGKYSGDLGKYTERTCTHVWFCMYMCVHVVVVIELRLHEYIRPCLLALCLTLSRPHLPCMRKYLGWGDSVILNEDACVGLSENIPTTFSVRSARLDADVQSNQHWPFVCNLIRLQPCSCSLPAGNPCSFTSSSNKGRNWA